MKKLPEVDPVVDPFLKVTLKDKVVHKANITWQFCKGKKRLAGNVLTIAGAAVLKAGDVVLGSALLAGASLLGGVALVEKTGEKLNEKTSGSKINWIEVLGFIYDAVKRLCQYVVRIKKPKTED